MSDEQQARPSRAVTLACLLGVGLILVASTMAGGNGDDAGRPAPAGKAPRVSLRIAYASGEESKRGSLTCAGSAVRRRGFLADRDGVRLCRRARRLATFLSKPPDRDRACSEIYGGSDTAQVSGRIGEADIDRRFSRSEGCEIADWDRAQVLLPEPVGAPAP